MLVLSLHALLHLANGQFKTTSAQFAELKAQRDAELDEALKTHPDLVHMYYPMRNSIPREYYMCAVRFWDDFRSRHTSRSPMLQIGREERQPSKSRRLLRECHFRSVP